MTFNWNAVIKYFPDLLVASITTIELVVVACLLGLLFGVLVGLARLSKNPILAMPAFLYSFFFRGTPLLVQIFLIYYGLGQFEAVKNSFLWEPVLAKPYWCAIIAFSMNTTAYISEIVRGAVLAIPKGELEAAEAIGMSKTLKLRRIILPRAFGIMVPAYSNEVIFMIKGSALASTIAIMDLMGRTRSIIAETYLNFELYVAAGIIYLALSFIFMGIARVFERFINRYKYFKLDALQKQATN